jgi:tetratricopeptide (TPR) repeat protein
MVKPSAVSDVCVRLVISGLCGDPLGTNVWSSDQAAIERGEFQSAIKHMLPRQSELTDDALVDLALALDATGRRREAIKVLEGRKQLSTDALGTLAGRYKRLWLFDGTASDVERSYDLYSRALTASEASADYAQVFYHAINLAFLELAHFKRRGACKILAQKALNACESAEPKDFWNFATQGEAWLYLSDINRTIEAYCAALRLGPKPRQIDSAYTQAMLAAERSLGERPTTLSRVFEQANR